jgi:integrase
VRLFASTEAAGRDRLTQEEIDALGFTGELPNGRRYVTASAAEPVGRRVNGHPPGGTTRPSTWARTCVAADLEHGRRRRGASVPLPAYQVHHTHASWLVDQGVDLARVQYRLGHGDLQATTRHVKIFDEEDPKAADVISAILGDVA